jgi:excisionase family DNA binding protein
MSISSSPPPPNSGDNQQHPNGQGPQHSYITTRQAAELLGVNRATVINWARQGRFNAIQYGNRGIYRFDRAEIVRFLNQSRLQKDDDAPPPNGAYHQ